MATQKEIQAAINQTTLSLHDRILTCMVPVPAVGRSPTNQVRKKGKPQPGPKTFDEMESRRLQFEERLAAEVAAVFGE